MSLLQTIQALDLNLFQAALISTTSKQHGENKLLPFRDLGPEKALNILLTDVKLAKEILVYLDNHIDTFFIDTERKQSIDLWQLAQTVLKNAKIFPYKPNDLTVESAYHLVNQCFDYQLNHKECLIYGTGNIATKLALRLAEQDMEVSLTGRNHAKIKQLIHALNLILPPFNESKITLFNPTKRYDVFITAVTAEHIIQSNYVDYLMPEALVIDIGINNLAPCFISKAQEKVASILRLDVRIASPILYAHKQIADLSFLKTHSGRLVLNHINCVAGGTIGKEGDIVLDTKNKPKHIIGIANGTGGLKKNEEYTDFDKCNLEIIQKTI